MTTWDKIPEVGKAVSGEGHYEASFDWDADSATGAYLDLGDTLQESMAVWINGTKVGGQASSNPTKATKDVGGVGKPTIDDGTGNQVPLVGQDIDSGGISWTKPLADVSGYLVDGTNTIVIEYNSALSNVQLDRGINVETQNVNNWWKNNFEYLSFGPERAKLVPFVDVEYSAKAATRVSAAPVRSTYGKASTIVVRVAGDNPSGTVTLRNGASAVGSAPVVNGTASIRLAGTALPAGSRSLQAVYAGDAANRSGTGPVAVTVAKARTRLTVKVAPTKVKPGRHAKL
ncbi:MAG: Ig-like domain-containing protein, partial [Patulibacter sp.]